MIITHKDLIIKEKNKLFANYHKVERANADINICANKKGPGKTMGAMREIIIYFIKDFKKGAYIRLTIEQIKFFCGKFIQVLIDLGLRFRIGIKNSIWKHIKINENGVKIKLTSPKTNKYEWTDFIIFIACSEVNKIQSASFDNQNIRTVVIDEVENHFNNTETLQVFNSVVNLISSLTRINLKIKVYILFNLVNINTNIFLQKFRLTKEILGLKNNQTISVLRTRKYLSEVDNKWYKSVIKICVWKPCGSSKWQKQNEKTLHFKMSLYTEYGRVINSSNFFTGERGLKYIKVLGDYMYTINIFGVKFGVWRDKKNGDYQIHSSYNRTGLVDFFRFEDYEYNGFFQSPKRVKKIARALIAHNIQFQDFYSFIFLTKILKFAETKNSEIIGENFNSIN